MTTTKMMFSLLCSGLLLPTPATAAEPPATSTAAPDQASELICRKRPETGSLVKVRKTCHTRAQWRYLDDENRRVSNNFVEENRGKPNGGN